jgi:hypothetical protein
VSSVIVAVCAVVIVVIVVVVVTVVVDARSPSASLDGVLGITVRPELALDCRHRRPGPSPRS